MNRRGFLGMLAAAIADPERLLWTPGKKLISVPSPPVVLGQFGVDARQFGVNFVYTRDEMSLASDILEERYVLPAIHALVAKIDREFLSAQYHSLALPQGVSSAVFKDRFRRITYFDSTRCETICRIDALVTQKV